MLNLLNDEVEELKKVRKAIIPAAGLGTRFLPATKAMPKEMLPIVDKPTIQYIVEEAISSGIEDIIIVTGKGKRAIEDHFDASPELERNLLEKGKLDLLEKVQHSSNLANIHYIRQKEPKGLGHAVWCARNFIGNEPFAVLLGDDIVVSDTPCVKQLIDQYEETGSSVIGVQKVEHNQTHRYGIIDPFTIEGRRYQVSNFVEKPEQGTAPSNLAIMGRYLLTPEIFYLLENQETGAGGEIQLTDAVQKLNSLQNVYAYEFEGSRYDVGEKLGFVKTTLDFALKHDELKGSLIEYIEELLNQEKKTLNRLGSEERV
jgi:UTP--glucose-1-phosphate uridylyltransferase